MHLDEAEVARRVARDAGNFFDAQAGLHHRVAHRHAVGVALVQPCRIELPEQRARAEEGRLVALAFLFGEADDLEAVWQALASRVQLAHAGHRHKDAEPAVVLAAVAHGVVVRAGQQALRAAVGAVIDAHHIAHRIDGHLVEAAFAHPVRQALRAGAVGVGEVGDGELPGFRVAGVAVLRQRFGPVPHEVAERGRDAELVVQANLGDAVDVAQAFGELELGMALQPPLEGRDDLAAREARAALASHREDERPAEFRVVVGVEPLERRELLGRAVRQAGARLLLRRFGRQRAGDHRLAGQFRVRAHQGELAVALGVAHDVHERELQVREALERSRFQRGFDDPRRMFVQPVQPGAGVGRACRVEVSEGEGHQAAP